MSDKLIKDFEELLQNRRYYVEDIISSESEVLLILESPDIDELKKGYPLAGSSGKNISRLVFSKDSEYHNKAFGEIIWQNANTNKYNISIMNVCNIPMNMEIYHCDDIRTNCELLCLLNRIKREIERNKSGAPNKKTLEKNSLLFEKLKGDLQQRLQILSDSVKIVPCGKVANYFLRQIDTDRYAQDRVIKNIPHPSRNQWDQEKYKTDVASVKKILIEKISGVPK